MFKVVLIEVIIIRRNSLTSLHKSGAASCCTAGIVCPHTSRLVLTLAETPKQVASHEVSPRFGPPGLCRGGARGPGEGGLHRVWAVLRGEGSPASPQPSLPSLPSLLLLCRPSYLLLQGDFSPGTSRIWWISVPNGPLRLRSRPIERYLRLDRAASDTRKWEDPVKLIPDLNLLSSFCWQGTDLPGAEGGKSIDDLDSVSIG